MPKRILVIDDDVAISASYAAALKEAGFEVETAKRGEEGIAKFKEKKADLIFADLQMPGLADGVTVIRKIHALDPKVPIYLVTGHAMEFLNALTGEVREGSHFKVLHKPVSLSELVNVAQQTLNVA